MMSRRTRRAVIAALLGALLLTTGCNGGGTSVARSRSVEVWAVGDGPNGKPAAKAVADLISDNKPDRLIYLGDVYGDYAKLFDGTFGSRGLTKITLPTPGNHDWPSQRAGYLTYWSKVNGTPQRSYYATRLGGWEILSLNSEEPIGRGSVQYRWLTRQLRGPGTCRLAFLHRPRWSAGRHGDRRELAAAWDALSRHAVLMLAGHDHTMQRLAPRDGITQLVAGSGGRNFYPIDQAYAGLRFGNNTDFGALRLRLTADRADFAFVTVDGDVLDSGRVACEPA